MPKKPTKISRNTDMVREVNSYLFWCKKKMTNKELDQYLAALGKDTKKKAAVQRAMAKMDAVVKEEGHNR